MVKILVLDLFENFEELNLGHYLLHVLSIEFFIVKYIYNIKFTILTISQCIVNWHEVHLQCYTTITSIYFQNFSFSFSSKYFLFSLKNSLTHVLFRNVVFNLQVF